MARLRGRPIGSSPESSAFPDPGIPREEATRLTSNKVSRGRFLKDVSAVYDVDVRVPGEEQPQLVVTPITKYNSDPQLVLGRQIAVNKSYICYALKKGGIVVDVRTATDSASWSLLRLRGHSERITDMAFFAEDVDLLASVSKDGRICMWKIVESPEEDGIIADRIAAIQVQGEEFVHPQVCWHCHNQEFLVVGVGRHILRIDSTKVGSFSPEEPIRCPLDNLVDGVQLVGEHDGEITDLSMCEWVTSHLVSASIDGTIKIWADQKQQLLLVMRPHGGLPVNAVSFVESPHHPNHILLITAGLLNREIKVWTSSSDEGWLLITDEWECTQTLDLKSSSQPHEGSFFNQVLVLPEVDLLLLANGKRNAIYAMHLEFGPHPAASKMDYLTEFTVTMPILSFTGITETSPSGEHVVRIYCVQTQAIQQYALDLSLCMPPPLENLGVQKSESIVSCEVGTSPLPYVNVVNVAPNYVADEVSELPASKLTPQTSSPARKQRQKKKTQAMATSSSPSALNSADSSNEALIKSNSVMRDTLPQILAMRDTLNQVMAMQNELKRLIAATVGVSKGDSDAMWVHFQEENVKKENQLQDQTQQIITLINNFINMDIPAMLERTLEKELPSIQTSVFRTITPTIEKIVSSAIAETFQEVVNQLDRSLNAKLEIAVAQQIRSLFQTSAKQAIQDSLKSSIEAFAVPGFEAACKAMFGQVESAFQSGLTEHTSAAIQHLNTANSSLTVTLQDAISSASSVVNALAGELADGQRKLLSLALAGANSSAINPMFQLPPVDPKIQLSLLISELKYDEAFTLALQKTDASVVSWLCSQVDLRSVLALAPLSMSQGVLLSLLQQLACDISNDTTRKISWMTSIVDALNPTDPMIVMHARPILELVNQILKYQRTVPSQTGPDLSSIRILMHVINSTLTNCK